MSVEARARKGLEHEASRCKESLVETLFLLNHKIQIGQDQFLKFDSGLSSVPSSCLRPHQLPSSAFQQADEQEALMALALMPKQRSWALRSQSGP